MIVVIEDMNKFSNVFGADCFLNLYPELLTTGIEVRYIDIGLGKYYYIIKDDKLVHDSQFFTKEDMKSLKIIKNG